MLGTKEHYDVIDFFDRVNTNLRLDKEPKNLWKKGIIYQDGEVNDLFKQFLAGYNYGKAMQEGD